MVHIRNQTRNAAQPEDGSFPVLPHPDKAPEEDGRGRFTPGPWEYIPSNEHHGPYVAGPWGGDICDCYTMSNPDQPSTRNGGISRPIHFQHEMADANARLIAAAPEMYEALKKAREFIANGVEMGVIRMPDASTPDPAHDTLPAIDAALKAGAPA